MTALSFNLADDLSSRLRARARKQGFKDLESYIRAMLLADAAGPGVSDKKLESMLLGRAEGPFVDMDGADFRRMRRKLKDRLSRNHSRRGESRR